MHRCFIGDVIPGEENFRLYWKPFIGGRSSFKDIPPIDAASNGYTYWIDYGYQSMFNTHIHEGHASLWAFKKSPTDQRLISLYYAHDDSPIFDTSYLVNISGYGDITVEGNAINLDTMEGTFSF